MARHKNGKKRAKESQLAIRVAKDERDTFVKLCEEMDTTAAREIRRLMREFVAANSAAPVDAGEGAEVVETAVLVESAGTSSELPREAADQVAAAALPEVSTNVEKHEGKAPKKKHKK